MLNTDSKMYKHALYLLPDSKQYNVLKN